jgi:hypothetical protein
MARQLLEAAISASRDEQGLRVAAADVAFSQPTPAGRRLATAFFGTERFLVYREAD